MSTHGQGSNERLVHGHVRGFGYTAMIDGDVMSDDMQSKLLFDSWYSHDEVTNQVYIKLCLSNIIV